MKLPDEAIITIARLLAAVLTGFGLTAVAVPLARRAALRWGITAPAENGETLPWTTPLMGGIPIVLAIVASSWWFGRPPLWMLLGGGGLMLVGQYDDWRALEPSRKLLLEVVVVAAALVFFPRPALTSWSLISLLLTGFFLLSTINAYNLIDGLDGLAGGVGIAAALGSAVLAGLARDWRLMGETLGVGGALGGFMLYNYTPARIFMGDCGALPVGFLLGAMALSVGGRSNSAPARAALPILIMLTPLLDVATVSLARIARGSPVMRRGRDHAHYRLLRRGLRSKSVVAICWTVSALAATGAIALAITPAALIGLVLPALVLCIAVVGRFILELETGREQSDPVIEVDARRNAGWSKRLALIAMLVIDAIAVMSAYTGALLIRLGGAIDEAQASAILSNVPVVIAASIFALICARVYRRGERGGVEFTRLASASAASGIILVLTGYYLALIFSGTIALLFVILLFGTLVLTRSASAAMSRGIGRLARGPQKRASVEEAYAALSPSMSSDKSTLDETESSTKLLAR